MKAYTDAMQFLRGLARELPGLFPRAPRRRACRPPRRSRRTLRPSPSQREAAREVITARAAHWAALLGLEYNRIAIKSQRTLWASCSRRGNLNFNWRLASAPPEVLDYIVIHELCHLREMNHSRRFWWHVAAACPGYKEIRRWLRKNTVSLLYGEPAAEGTCQT